jgi:putative DNA primase/helicase
MLMTLMDRSKWREHFATENGIAWDEAQNHIIRKAERSPVFDPNLVRGVGAWDDCGKLVINDGETIFCDDEEYELFNAPGKYVYERGRRLPYTTHDPIDTEAAKRLIDMLSLIGWKRKADPMILAGWILLAPFGGALKWRPHVWMTAAKGSGKTWTMDNIVHPMVSDDFGRKGLGSSTSAGVRNELEGSSVPLTMDEMETDNDKQRETIEQTIRIFREGSGGTGSAATLHAAAEGGSKHWLVRSMALFASIASGLTHGADKDRFVNIDLSINPNEEHALRAERFNQLQNAVRETITESWARGFVHRTLKMWPDLTRCIDVMVQQVAEITGSRRDGDTIGTLMAGAWMSFNSKAPSAAEARKWLTEQGIGEMSSDLDQHKDELVCLEELMAARIEVEASNRRATIGSLINGWYNTEIKVISNEPDPEIKSYEAKKALEAYGIKLINRNAGARILIARKHPGIRKIMRDTAWSSSYTEILKRLDCCLRDNAGPARFCGIAFRHLELDAEKIFGQQEYEKMEEAPF